MPERIDDEYTEQAEEAVVEEEEEEEVVVPVNVEHIHLELVKSKTDNQMLKDEIKCIKEEAAKIICAKNMEIKDLKENLSIVNKTLRKQHLERKSTNHLTLESENTVQGSSQPEPVEPESIRQENMLLESSENEIYSPIPVMVESVRKSTRVVGTELMRITDEKIAKKMEQRNDQEHGLQLDALIGNKGAGIRVSIF